MSLKIDLTSPAVDRQISVLKEFPRLADKRYRPVVKKDTAALAAIVQPNIPRRSGFAANTFGSKVSGRGFNLKGQLGWYDQTDPWYINIVEYGAAAHAINTAPVKSNLLAYRTGNGEMGFSAGHTIQHPGFGARGFMAAAEEAMGPMVEADLAAANEQILSDLAAL